MGMQEKVIEQDELSLHAAQLEALRAYSMARVADRYHNTAESLASYVKARDAAELVGAVWHGGFRISPLITDEEKAIVDKECRVERERLIALYGWHYYA